MKLQGSKILITGGSLGIGKETAKCLVDAGAIVGITGRDAQRLNAAAEYSGAFPIVADVTKPEDIERTYQEFLAHAGGLDVLINNAGITRDAAFAKMTTDQWQKVIDVNLTGVFNCCKVISPVMVKQNFGRIINTSSIVGLYGNYGQANYAATKAGVIAFTKTLARELGKFNITVNAVAPGFIATDMIQSIPEKVIEMLS